MISTLGFILGIIVVLFFVVVLLSLVVTVPSGGFQWGYINLNNSAGDFTYLTHIVEYIKHSWTVTVLKICNFYLGIINYIKYGAMDEEQLEAVINGTSTSTQTTLETAYDWGKTFITDNSNVISRIITVSIILSLAAIILKYGTRIFTTYFMVNDSDDTAPAASTDFFKRTGFALLMSLILPYLLINGYLVFMQIGISAGNTIMTDKTNKMMVSNQEAEKIMARYYRDSKEYGISLTTYCENDQAQADFGGSGWQNALRDTAVIANSDDNYLYITYCSEPLGEKSPVNKIDSKEYNNGESWVGKYPVMVAQHMFDVLPQDAFPKTPISSLVSFTPIIGSIFYLVSMLIIFSSCTKDLSTLLGTMFGIWYYMRDYIESGGAGETLTGFYKRIFGIFMHEFFNIVLYVVIMDYWYSQEKISLISVLLAWAIFKIMKNSEGFIQDITQSTNSSFGSLSSISHGGSLPKQLSDDEITAAQNAAAEQDAASTSSYNNQ